MRFTLLNLLAPHYCCSCGEIGSILCDSCKYDITNELPVVCIQCMRPVKAYGVVCSRCSTYYTRGWFTGYHRESLRTLVQELKFKSSKAAGVALAELLADSLPHLPKDTIITAIPTVANHKRQRGFDHTKVIAGHLANLTKTSFKQTLVRSHTYSQRGADKATRLIQAKTAYKAVNVSKDARYLLIDDVCTTGATVNYAAKELLMAGAKEVWVAVVSREPLD